MLRFRNRFKGQTSDLSKCGCGRHVTTSYAEGRWTIIHELPWCDRFTEFMAELKAGGAQMHQAVVLAAPSLGVASTAVVADGDSLDDVKDPVPAPSSGGGVS